MLFVSDCKNEIKRSKQQFPGIENLCLLCKSVDYPAFMFTAGVDECPELGMDAGT